MLVETWAEIACIANAQIIWRYVIDKAVRFFLPLFLLARVDLGHHGYQEKLSTKLGKMCITKKSIISHFVQGHLVSSSSSSSSPVSSFPCVCPRHECNAHHPWHTINPWTAPSQEPCLLLWKKVSIDNCLTHTHTHTHTYSHTHTHTQKAMRSKCTVHTNSKTDCNSAYF